MTEPHQPKQSAGEEGSGQDEALAQSQGKAGEGDTQQAPSAETQHTQTENTKAEKADGENTQGEKSEAESTKVETGTAEKADAENTDVEGLPAAKQKGSKKGLLLGIGGGAVVVAIVALALAAFVWPGFLAGPGKPDGKASEATAALASKNAGEVEKVSCHGPDGKVTTQIPQQDLQLIQSAKSAGPPHLALDTEALVPVDLTLSAQGKTQTAPVDVVLGVTNNKWCMRGISQRQ